MNTFRKCPGCEKNVFDEAFYCPLNSDNEMAINSGIKKVKRNGFRKVVVSEGEKYVGAHQDVHNSLDSGDDYYDELDDDFYNDDIFLWDKVVRWFMERIRV